MDFQPYLDSANVQAFLRMIRVGEGTSGLNGYHMLAGGKTFTDLRWHPNILVEIKSGTRTIPSTAAGAYQILYRTWGDLVAQYAFADFGPDSQDKAAVALINGRGALEAVTKGRLAPAIQMCAFEWASLPGAPYGQPERTWQQAEADYLANGGTVA